jgi:glycosyltransferase involved in cell wall biosynthesis
VIPCFNEAASIGSLVSAVRKILPVVLVVDDGSTDGTSTAARVAGAQVIAHSHNRGKGAALSTGWRHAQEGGFSWVLSMDGDGQHAVADVSAFLRCAETTNASLVIGNRLGHPDGMPLVRRFVNRWMSATISRRAGVDLPDTQCGFRLMKLAAWQTLRLQTTHFEIESELLLAFVHAGFPVGFVPIEVIYGAEQSKIHPMRDAWRWFRWWWRAGDASQRKAQTKPIPACEPAE